MMIYLFIFMDEIKVRDELTARSETQDLLMQLMLWVKPIGHVFY